MVFGQRILLPRLLIFRQYYSFHAPTISVPQLATSVLFTGYVSFFAATKFTSRFCSTHHLVLPLATDNSSVQKTTNADKFEEILYYTLD